MPAKYFLCFEDFLPTEFFLTYPILCVKSVRIRNYSGPHFPEFGLNTERCSVTLCRYSVSLRIQSECGKMRTRIIQSTDTFYAVILVWSRLRRTDIIWTYCVSCWVMSGENWKLFISKTFQLEKIGNSFFGQSVFPLSFAVNVW